jgi:hypothetical protein
VGCYRRLGWLDQGEVVLVFLGGVELQDGMQAVEPTAEFDEIFGLGVVVDVAEEPPRRWVWWLISAWARLMVPVGSVPPSAPFVNHRRPGFDPAVHPDDRLHDQHITDHHHVDVDPQSVRPGGGHHPADRKDTAINVVVAHKAWASSAEKRSTRTPPSPPPPADMAIRARPGRPGGRQVLVGSERRCRTHAHTTSLVQATHAARTRTRVGCRHRQGPIAEDSGSFYPANCDGDAGRSTDDRTGR